MLNDDEAKVQLGFVHEVVDDAQVHIRDNIKRSTFGYQGMSNHVVKDFWDILQICGVKGVIFFGVLDYELITVNSNIIVP